MLLMVMVEVVLVLRSANYTLQKIFFTDKHDVGFSSSHDQHTATHYYIVG